MWSMDGKHHVFDSPAAVGGVATAGGASPKADSLTGGPAETSVDHKGWGGIKQAIGGVPQNKVVPEPPTLSPPEMALAVNDTTANPRLPPVLPHMISGNGGSSYDGSATSNDQVHQSPGQASPDALAALSAR